MTPEHWRKVEEVFEAVIARPPEERATFLDEICANDQLLRADVDSLLDHDKRAVNFIEEPAFRIAPTLSTTDSSESLIGQSIGFYTSSPSRRI